MASKPHKHVLTSVPPVGFELYEGSQRFVVEASRAHTARDGRATAVIDWLGACLVCGCDIRQQTGVLIRYFNKRCAAHSKWNAGRVEAPNAANGLRYVAAEPPAGATFSGRSALDGPPVAVAPERPLTCKRVIVTDVRGARLRGEAFFSDGEFLPFGYSAAGGATVLMPDGSSGARYAATLAPFFAELDVRIELGA